MNLFLVCDYAYAVTVPFLEIASFIPGKTGETLIRKLLTSVLSSV